MAVMRTKSELKIKAPPPSPIPTATGSRCAANETLSEFLEKSLQVPDLSLPGTPARHLATPEGINLRSLAARESSSVARLLRSAHESGAFLIGCHGIPDEELRSVAKEAGKVFGVLEERDTGFRRYYGCDREEIVWVRTRDQRLEWARQYVGAHLYQSFSEKMEHIASRLDEIAEELGQIFVENAQKPFGGRMMMKRRESVLSIYRFNYGNIVREQNPTPPSSSSSSSSEEGSSTSLDYIFSLHLVAGKHCQFCVNSGSGFLSFDAGPDTIVVTVGKQLEVRDCYFN